MTTTAKIEVTDGNPVAALQEFLKKLQALDGISGVLVSRHMPARGVVMPSLVTDPEQMDTADPLAPAFPMSAAKLAAKLTRGHVEGNLAAVLRPCEIRGFIELVKLNQGSMENILLIGFDCPGAYANTEYSKFLADKNPQEATRDFLISAFNGGVQDDPPLSRACQACENFMPGQADLTIGLAGADLNKSLALISNTPRGEGLLTRLEMSDAGEQPGRKQALDAIMEKRVAARDAMLSETDEEVNTLEKLTNYLAGCVNCYNCRVACPVCYCKECVFVTDVFDHKPWQYMGWAKQQGALRMPVDTVFYHMTRLAHMSVSCVGCGQCSNACPNNVPVMELFRTVGKSVQEAFDYQPGRSVHDPIPLSVFHEKEFSEVTGGVD